MAAFAKTEQILFEVAAVKAFFEDPATLRDEQISIVLVNIRTVAYREDIPVPAAFPIHIRLRQIGSNGKYSRQ
jgi:hypothetical protein